MNPSQQKVSQPSQRDAAKRRGLERRKETVKLDPYRKALLNGLVSLKERMDQQKQTTGNRSRG